MKKQHVIREIQQEISAAVQQFPVVVVIGARQTGKSTLLLHLFPQAEYLTLDDPLTRQAAQEDPRTFLTRAPQMIIDEIHNLPELLPYIKIAVDAKRQANGRFLLTGSQVFRLWQVSVSLWQDGRRSIVCIPSRALNWVGGH